MRMMVAADFLTYVKALSNSRDGRVWSLVVIGTWATAIRFLPAWMIVSSV